MSSRLNAAQGALASASADVNGIGEAIREATTAAAEPTTSIVPAAADEVSAAITRLFGTYGQEFQSLTAQSAAFHARFVQSLSSGGAAYATAEAANADPFHGANAVDGGNGGAGGKAGVWGAGGADGLIGGGNGGTGVGLGPYGFAFGGGRPSND
jgi:hypothetical protein